jgi:hypothetical protein
MNRTLRLTFLLAITVVATAVAGTPAVAGGIIDPAPIAPNNYFFGQVNGHTSGATIGVICVGPVAVGQTGRPAANQTVNAIPTTPPTSTTAGFTGTAANSIDVRIGVASAVVPIVLHDWVVTAPIQVTLSMPCSGTGTVTFAPAPSSPTAKPATVQVTFVAQP